VHLCCGACLCLSVGAHAAQSAPAGYDKAKIRLDRLFDDPKRSAWREPWAQLADEFYDIYRQEKDWINRPAALYRSALALDELSRRSFNRKDAENAKKRYLQLADAHPASPLADDALLQIARLHADRLSDVPGAIGLVEDLCARYPKSDSCLQGRILAGEYASRPPGEPARKAGKDADRVRPAQTQAAQAEEKDAPRKAGKADSTGRPARITALKWDTRGPGVTVEIGLSGPSPWELRSRAADAKKGVRPALILELPGTRPDDSVSPGARIERSSLQRVRLDYHQPDFTRILLDFSKLARFSIQSGDDGKKLIIHTAGNAAALPGGLTPGNVVRSPAAMEAERRRAASSPMLAATRNIASQFGLNVRTVVIDAGHGGKDPGTHHNGILERAVTLDVALQLGKVLKSKGFEVKHTRTRDVWIPLQDRAALANKLNGDLFISLHVNASHNPKKTGIETYYLDVAGSTAAAGVASFENMLSNRKLGDLERMIGDLMLNARKSESIRLAQDVQQKILDRLRRKGFPTENGGARGAPFVVLLGTHMPAILVEIGYCTNVQEAKRLATAAYREALVQGIVGGVETYADRLRTANP
jgi:N-acetylmuramoyl-L-alanine amidase